MTTQFRFNRGSFSESMENVVAVNSKEELLFQIRRFAGMSELASASADELMFRDTGPESRNGWANSFLVMLRGYPMGFASGDFSELSADGEEAQPPVNEGWLLSKLVLDIEAEYGIQVLGVRIMGSHLWGTANGSSDYDIQFVYVRHLHDYLGFLPSKQIRYEKVVHVDGAAAHLDVFGYEASAFVQLMSKTDMMATQFLAAPAPNGVPKWSCMEELTKLHERMMRPNLLIRKYVGHAKSSFYVNVTGPKTNRMALQSLAFAAQLRTIGKLKDLNLHVACSMYLPTLQLVRDDTGQILDFDRPHFDRMLKATDEWDLSYEPRTDEELAEFDTMSKRLIRRYANDTWRG